MHKFLAAASALLMIAACGEQSTSPAPTAAAPTTPPSAYSAPTPAPNTVNVIVDVPKIAGKTQREVAASIGEPTSCENVKQGKKRFYRHGETEIVFISGKADWITIEALRSARYSDTALPMLGFGRAVATFSSEYSIRWESIPGVLEVSVFPAQNGVDYAYIKTATR